jgi:DNA polymerase IIIc chi subunit
MDPSIIELDSINKMFEYEKLARMVDSLTEDEAKDCAKAYIKLYLKQQEVIASF